jgi:hypothetical protein
VGRARSPWVSPGTGGPPCRAAGSLRPGKRGGGDASQRLAAARRRTGGLPVPLPVRDDSAGAGRPGARHGEHRHDRTHRPRHPRPRRAGGAARALPREAHRTCPARSRPQGDPAEVAVSHTRCRAVPPRRAGRHARAVVPAGPEDRAGAHHGDGAVPRHRAVPPVRAAGRHRPEGVTGSPRRPSRSRRTRRHHRSQDPHDGHTHHLTPGPPFLEMAFRSIFGQCGKRREGIAAGLVPRYGTGTGRSSRIRPSGT